MRILLVPSTYPPVLGGVQTVTHNLAKHLLQRGHEVQVVTNRYPRTLPAHESLDGVSVRRLLFLSPDINSLRRRRADLFLASFYFYPLGLWRLRKLMRSFRPDVVNVHFPAHQTHFVLALRHWFGFRLVVSLHGSDIDSVTMNSSVRKDKAPDSVATKRLQLILREADAVTACSKPLLDQAIVLEPSIARKAQVIHNGIDPQRFLDKAPYPHPRPYALAIGRLVHSKGFDMLLKAFAQAESVSRGVDLIIAGEGEEQNALTLRAQQLGLASRVHFIGRATPEKVIRLLNGSLFVVVPSRSESFGIAALEALAAGKPVLATNTGGLPELLAEFGEGTLRTDQQPLSIRRNSSFGPGPVVRLVDPNAEELANGLRQMCELPGNDSSVMGHYRISDKYSWAQVARCYENVLVGGIS